MSVTELRDLDAVAVDRLVSSYGLELIKVDENERIPASFWGEPEAGIAGRCLFVRPDTPVHSLLHELGHFVCMTPERRAVLWRDAGGDDDEEAAVCYLQVVLADTLPGMGRQRLLADLDAWGYSFREGSAAGWLDGDGRAARDWLTTHQLIDGADRPTWQVRQGLT
ncbi:MAG: hypothetical protein ACR2QQ_08390 [Gammaproteobacteria bacterium]